MSMPPKWRVRIGSPARTRTRIVYAPTPDAAIDAVVRILRDEDEPAEWLDKHANNRTPAATATATATRID